MAEAVGHLLISYWSIVGQKFASLPARSGIRSLSGYFRPFKKKEKKTINLTMTDVHCTKILNCVWLPFCIMILGKVGNNLALGGDVETVYHVVTIIMLQVLGFPSTFPSPPPSLPS